MSTKSLPFNSRAIATAPPRAVLRRRVLVAAAVVRHVIHDALVSHDQRDELLAGVLELLDDVAVNLQDKPPAASLPAVLS